MRMTIREALSVLQLTPPVSHDDVRKAFRMKAKQYHPDKFTDETRQKEVSVIFVRVKEASTLLLELTEQQINHPGPERRPVQRVKRTYRPAPVAGPSIMDHPLVKEVDNVVKLFHLVGQTSNMNYLKAILVDGRFSPGNFIGRLYERFFETRYAGEDRLDGFAYGFLLFLRLLWGSIFLIVSFFGMAILGLMGAVLIFPPLMIFYCVYWMYHRLLKPMVKKLNAEIQVGNKSSWLQARSRYLWYRTLPLPIMAAICWLAVLACSSGTFYLITLSYVLCFFFFLLSMSILYEWLHFMKIRKVQV